MTKNTYVDSPAKPDELWAAPARSPQGRFGILIARGDVTVTFIDETRVEEFLLRLVDTGSEQPLGAQGINMVRAAQRDLPKFKAAQRDAAAVNN